MTLDGAEPSPFAEHGELDRPITPAGPSGQRLRSLVSTVVVGLLFLGWVVGRSTGNGGSRATSVIAATVP